MTETHAGAYISKQDEMDELLDRVFDDLTENEKKEGMGDEGWIDDTGDDYQSLVPVTNTTVRTEPTREMPYAAFNDGSISPAHSVSLSPSGSPRPHVLQDEQKEESSRHRRKKKKKKRRKHTDVVQIALYDPNLDRIKETCAEIDDDGNGMLDFGDFHEVLTMIDQAITRPQAQDMYNEITWTSDYELRISDFIDVIVRRVTTQSRSPAHLLFQAFPHIFDDPTGGEVDGTEGPLVISIISSTMHDQDDDENGFMDLGDFSGGLKDLGLTLDRHLNEVVFEHYIDLQQSSFQNPSGVENDELLQEELEIESFIEAIRPIAIASPSLQIHQVLQAAFSPILESRRGRKRSRYKKQQKAQPQSIIYKRDFELSSRALRSILRDCDDDRDGALDFTEFEEGMVALKTTLPRAGLRAVFNYCCTESELGIEDFINVLCDCHVENPAGSMHDLVMEIARRGRFTNITRQSVIMLADFGKRNSTRSIVGDGGGEYRRRQSRHFDIDSLPEDLQVTGDYALRALRTLLDDLDDNADGNVDFDEFRSLLREVGLDNRFSQYEQETCFKRLSFTNTTGQDIAEIEASLMGINQVLAMIVMDHPDINCHKLVYKLMKRILKGARRRTQSKMRGHG